MTNTIPATFLNKEGLKLFGILHKPNKDVNNKTAIIILSPGIKSRVAPHRLYIKMARRFADMGYYVLRFDFYGLGDSEGEIIEKYVADFYGSVQVGRYINDTISAMDWMEKECNIKSFILAGLCGGAITGLLAGARDQRIKSLLGLGIPVILDSNNTQHQRYITAGQLDDVMKKQYFRNLFKWKSWIRFITFRSDYRLIVKGLILMINKIINKKEIGQEHKWGNVVQEIPEQLKGNFNWHFPPALKSLLSSSRKVLLIFSEADRLYWEFNEKYIAYFKKEIENYGANLSVHITKEANHIFSFKEWQEDMLDNSCSWLTKHA